MLSATLLECIAEDSPDGIVLVDEEGRIRFWNRTAEQMFGHQSAGKAGRAIDDEVVGARVRLFGIDHDGVFHHRGEK